jgi:hypothetical protein
MLACPARGGAECGSSACQCNTGYTGSACTACVAGKYKIVTGSGTCTDCAAGKYSTAIGATTETSCQLCLSNSYSPAASSSSTACLCNAGYTGGTCSACETGKYKSGTGPGACIDCAAGKHSTSGSIECQCNVPTYAEFQGASECSSCTLGTELDATWLLQLESRFDAQALSISNGETYAPFIQVDGVQCQADVSGLYYLDHIYFKLFKIL